MKRFKAEHFPIDLINEFSERFDRVLSSSRTVLLMPHVNMDGDALGSVLALFLHLKSLGKEPFIYSNDEVPQMYSLLPGVENVSTSLPDMEFDCAVLFESPDYSRVPAGKNFRAKTIINIDHHPDNTGYGDLIWVDPSSSSVGEIFFELFEILGYDLDYEIVLNLYVALFTDTGGFNYSNTNSKSHEIASRMLALHKLPVQEIARKVNAEMNKNVFKLLGKLISETKIYEESGIAIVTLTRKMLEEFGVQDADTQGFVRDLNLIEGVHTFAFLRETEGNTVKVSLRSTLISVGDVALRSGGGGHPRAAGYTSSMSLEKEEENITCILKDTVKRFLEENGSCRDYCHE